MRRSKMRIEAIVPANFWDMIPNPEEISVRIHPSKASRLEFRARPQETGFFTDAVGEITQSSSPDPKTGCPRLKNA